MIKVKKNEMKAIADLFQGNDDSMVIACLCLVQLLCFRKGGTGKSVPAGTPPLGIQNTWL